MFKFDHHFPENPPSVYIKAMAVRLRTSQKVVKYPMLKSRRWTEVCYEMLAKVVKEDLNGQLTKEQQMRMGTSLSFKTLQKIILEDYTIPYPIDARRLNTLNKVVIFLGYDSWGSFKNEIDIIQQKNKRTADSKKEVIEVIGTEIHAGKKKDTKKEIIEMVKTGIYNEYNAYYNLPKINKEILIKTHIKNASAFNFIVDILINKKENLTISNPSNPSTYAILDAKVKRLEATHAMVYTQEYWLLCWWNIHKNQYVHRYKNISDHFYILNKLNGSWKIKTNASTADPMGKL